MRREEPDFYVLDYITISKDARTGLVVALGGTEQAVGILQRAGFLDAPGPRGTYHRLPHGLPVEEQRRKATAASHALLTAGYSVHLDPALNDLAAPDGDREAALRYLAQLSQRATRAESSHDRAALLTEIASPAEGLLPLIRQAVVAAWVCSLLPDFSGTDRELAAQLEGPVDALSRATDQILLARNHIARAPNSSVRPPSQAQHTAAAVSRSR